MLLLVCTKKFKGRLPVPITFCCVVSLRGTCFIHGLPSALALVAFHLRGDHSQRGYRGWSAAVQSRSVMTRGHRTGEGARAARGAEQHQQHRGDRKEDLRHAGVLKLEQQNGVCREPIGSSERQRSRAENADGGATQPNRLLLGRTDGLPFQTDPSAPHKHTQAQLLGFPPAMLSNVLLAGRMVAYFSCGCRHRPRSSKRNRKFWWSLMVA